MKTALSESIRRFFNQLLESKQFQSGRELAEYLGISSSNPSALPRFLNGESNVGYETVCGWMERFGGKVVFPNINEVASIMDYAFVPKVEAVAGAGASLETSDAILGYYAFQRSFLQREHISEKNAVLLAVRGDSMEPLLYSGDTVMIDKSDTQIQDGKVYVVTLGDELCVKRIQRGIRGLILHSENSRYADIPVQDSDLEHFVIHGRVRWCAKML